MRLQPQEMNADNPTMMQSQPNHSPVLRRVLTLAACLGAFMVMASVFSPDQTRAGGPVDSLRGVPPKSVEYPTAHSSSNGASGFDHSSTNPHEGLMSLGTIEDRGYTIHIFATDGGARYTIYENATGEELGALLSAEQVHRTFPDLELPSMEFNGESPLMMAEPQSEWWW